MLIERNGSEMRNKLIVTFEGDHVRVIADGEKDHDFQERLWDEVAAVCQQHKCYRVFGASQSLVPLGIMDGYDVARMMRERDIGAQYRIAWIEYDDDAREVTEFIETVLFNRGLPGRLFPDEASAKKWLFQDLVAE